MVYNSIIFALCSLIVYHCWNA